MPEGLGFDPGFIPEQRRFVGTCLAKVKDDIAHYGVLVHQEELRQAKEEMRAAEKGTKPRKARRKLGFDLDHELRKLEHRKNRAATPLRGNSRESPRMSAVEADQRFFRFRGKKDDEEEEGMPGSPNRSPRKTKPAEASRLRRLRPQEGRGQVTFWAGGNGRHLGPGSYGWWEADSPKSLGAELPPTAHMATVPRCSCSIEEMVSALTSPRAPFPARGGEKPARAIAGGQCFSSVHSRCHCGY